VSRPGKKNELCADIIVSTDTAVRNAKAYKTSASYELNLYVVHGMLHFLGYDDKTARDRKKMDKKAAQYLLNIN